MVKIINGEIVRDNDPRLKQQGSTGIPSAGSSSLNSRSTGRNNIKDVFSNGSDVNGSERPSESPKKHKKDQSNPLESIAKALGIQDRTITLPAIGPLQISESKVGLVYCLVAILGIVIFGTKAALIIVVFYVLWKKSNVNNTEL